MNVLRTFIFSLPLCALIFLTGCATSTPDNLTPIEVNSASQAEAWEMRGKIAVRTADDKFSTNLYWLHTQLQEDVRLTTPLGTSVLHLNSRPELTQLEVNGEQYQHHDAQQLLQNVTGWSLPIESLPLWITGQVSVTDQVTEYDDLQRPKQLISSQGNQAWQVTFHSWQQQSGANIPRQLSVNRGDIRLKIQLSQWQALSTQGGAHRPEKNSELNDPSLVINKAASSLTGNK